MPTELNQFAGEQAVVQRGVTTLASSVGTTNVTISSVDISKSTVQTTIRSSLSSAGDLNAVLYTAELTNSTTLTFTKGSAQTGMIVAWEVKTHA